MAKPTILIVDDEDQFRESLSEALEEEFHVLMAPNVREGLRVIDKNSLDLILLDLQMPGLTGVDLLESLRSKNNNTPVFILTGNSCQNWAEKCADLNIQGYIKKPVDIENLMCRIKKHLGIEDFRVLQEIWKEKYDEIMVSMSRLVKNALIYLRQNMRNEFDRGKMAASLEVSPDYLTRQFHKECGLNMHDYIKKLRIQKSMELMRDPRLKIKEVAYEAGLKDVSYFCSVFKEHTGLTPKEFQKRFLSSSGALIASLLGFLSFLPDDAISFLPDFTSALSNVTLLL